MTGRALRLLSVYAVQPAALSCYATEKNPAAVALAQRSAMWSYVVRFVSMNTCSVSTGVGSGIMRAIVANRLAFGLG